MVQEALSLMGKTIAVTRSKEQAQETLMLIRKMGGKPYNMPTLEPKPLDVTAELKNFFKALENGRVDYTVFMSVNGVKFFLNQAEKLVSLEALKKILMNTVVVAVGPKTAQALMKAGIHVGIIPSEFSSKGVTETLKTLGARGKKVYAFRAKGAGTQLRNELASCGAEVNEVYLYENKGCKGANAARKFFRDLTSGRIHAIVFGSPKSVKNFFDMFSQMSLDELKKLMREKLTIVAIGPVTARSLEEEGTPADVIPDKYTFQAALEALARYWQR
ncbi:MAG: uroporphyrinogen-III synthase [Thermoproteota archaeon]